MNGHASQPRQRLLAYAAVLFALTVVPALAATTAPKNSVTSKSIKNGQVKKKDIATNAVNGARVAHNSLTGADIDEATLQGLGTPSGPAGGDLSGLYPNPQIGPGAVGTAKLADLSVTMPKLAEHAVTGDKVAHDTLTGVHIDESTFFTSPSGTAGGDLSGVYPNPQIANLAVSTAKLAPDAVNSAKVVDNSLSGSDIDESTFSTSPSGSAGGVLAGTYPAPTLDVSGGACANGQALTNVSDEAVLTCGRGVYSDGSQNLAVSLTPLSAGAANVAVGQTALQANPTGDSNSALGQGALSADTTGQWNSAVGTLALLSNTIGSSNSAVGQGSLQANSTGSVNSALGVNALAGNTTGTFNTAVGMSALFVNTTGSSNTALGRAAGNLITGNNNIDIANQGVDGESATTRIGTAGTQTRTFIAGIRGTTTVNPDAVQVLIDSAGQLGTVSSSRRYKEDIHAMGSASDPIMDLRPVTFRYRSGPHDLRYGLIAEQVAKAMPSLVVYDSSGRPETVQYQDLPVLLLNELQEERRHADALEAKLRRQTALNGRQQAQIDRLVHQVRGR